MVSTFLIHLSLLSSQDLQLRGNATLQPRMLFSNLRHSSFVVAKYQVAYQYNRLLVRTTSESRVLARSTGHVLVVLLSQ